MSNINGFYSISSLSGTAAAGQQAAVDGGGNSSDLHSWYEAMAKAWGSALDDQAGRITSLSQSISEGGQDNPATITLLTAESLRMQFLSSNAATSTNSVGQALESLARK